MLSLADIASLAILLAVIGLYTGRQSTYLPASLGDNTSLRAAIVFLIFFLLKNAVAYWMYTMQSQFAYSVASRISGNELLRYLKGDYTNYVSIDSAAQNHRISHQPIEFAHYVLSGIQQIITELLLATFAVVAILAYNAKLFAVLVVVLLPPTLIVMLLTRRKLRNARAAVKQDAESALQYLQEALQGYVESRVFQRQSFFTGRYFTRQQQLNSHLSDLQIAQWAPGRFLEIFAVAGLFALLLIYRHFGVSADTIAIGAFAAAAYKIIPGISRIAGISAQLRTYSYTLGSLAKEEFVASTDDLAALEPIKTISALGISFAHGDHAVLDNFRMELCKGDFVCLKAVSGGGKTTFLNLLLGFLEADKGTFEVNGVAASAAERTLWQRRIAYVRQQNFLIHDTIRANITLSDTQADPTRLHAVIAHTGLDALISTFAEGVDKIISDSGRNVSGGQRQRIAIARALYKDADLIILDEPFNELDYDSELKLLQHFKALAGEGKIVLLVSHSKNCEDWCNKIITIDA